MRLNKMRYQYGDLVFAKCTKNKPWPAKITKVHQANMYRVDFYNHNSLGIVDILDIEPLNEKTIQIYRKMFEKQISRNYILLREGILLAEKEFNRRKEIQNQEVEQWENSIPTQAEKIRLEKRLQIERDRPVEKPKKEHVIKEMVQKKRKEGKNESKKERQSRNREEAVKQNKVNSLPFKNEIWTRSKAAKEMQDDEDVDILSSENSDQSYREQQQIIEQKLKQAKKRSAKERKKTKNIKKKGGKKRVEKVNKYLKKRRKNQSKSVIVQIPDDKEATIEKINLSNQENIQNQKTNNSLIMQLQVRELPSINHSSFNNNSSNQTEEQNNQQNLQAMNEELRKINVSNTVSSLFNGVFPDKTQSCLKDLSNIDISANEFLKSEQPVKVAPSFSDSEVLVTEIAELYRVQQGNERKEAVVHQNIQQEKQISKEQVIQYHFQQNGNQSKQQQRSMINQNENHSDLSIHQSQIDKIMKEVIMSEDNFKESIESLNVKIENNMTITNLIENSFGNTLIKQEFVSQLSNDMVDHQKQANYEKSNELHKQKQLTCLQSLNNKHPIKIDDSNGDLLAYQMKQAMALVLRTSPEQIVKQQHFFESQNEQLRTNQKVNENTVQISNQMESTNQFCIENPLFNIFNETIPKPIIPQKLPQQVLSQKVSEIMIIPPAENLNTDPQNVSFDNPLMFEKIYADYSIPKNDFTLLVKGIPKLKRQLAEANRRHIVLCLNNYFQILKNFISQKAQGLQMWQKQIFIGIMDSDILDMSLLLSSETPVKMMNFIVAFESSGSRRRAECHLQYMLTSNRLDLYMSRYYLLKEKLNLKEGMKIPRSLQSRYGRV